MHINKILIFLYNYMYEAFFEGFKCKTVLVRKQLQPNGKSSWLRRPTLRLPFYAHLICNLGQVTQYILVYISKTEANKTDWIITRNK